MTPKPEFFSEYSLIRLAQGAAIGAVATLLIGFAGLGWVTGGTAQEIAKKQVETATIALMAPACAKNFAALTDGAARVIALAKADSWKKGDEFKDDTEKQWVTLPGESYPSSKLKEECIKIILAPPTKAADAAK